LTELARSLEQTKSLLFRVLHELEAQALVARDESGRYVLGLEAFELGAAYLAQHGFDSVMRGVLHGLSDRTGETVNLGVLDGTEILYTSKYVQPDAYVTISRVGGRVPAHCVAIGKVLLAELPDAVVAQRYDDVTMRTMTGRSISSLPDLLVELAAI